LRNFSILALFLGLLLTASCATVDTDEGSREREAESHFKLGVAYRNDNKIQQAFVEFHKAYELNPKNKEVVNAIGILYLLHLDDTQKALEYFDKATKLDPFYSEAYNNLGYAYEKMGSFDKAVTFYKKALSNPVYQTAEKAYFNLGNAYYRQGKFADAIAAFKESIRRVPDLHQPYLRLALCYNALGKYGDAADAMAQAIKTDPVYKGNREKALEDFTLRKLRTTGYEEQDLRDFIEIMKY